jgi:hypothetical protein
MALDIPLTPSGDATTGGDVNVNDIYNMTYGDNNLNNFLNQKYNYQVAPNPYQSQLDAQVARYSGALPEMAASTMFPSAANDIQKGSYSGSVVGSVPIYAPSHLVPFGVFDAKQRALRDAALAKQKDISDFYTANKAPITKRFAVQGELNDVFAEGMDKWIANAQKQYGKDWAGYLKQDQGFNNWVQSMQTVAQYEDGIVNKVGEIQALVKSGNFNASPALTKSMSDVMNGIGGLSNPFDPKGHQLGSSILRMNADYDVDKAVNTEIDKIIQDVYQTNPGISSQGIYDLITSTKTTGTDKTKLDLLADGLYKTRYAGSDYITRDDIYNRLYSLLGTKTERTIDHAANQFAGGSGADKTYEANAVNPESETVNYAGESGGVVTYDGQTFNPIKVNVPQSAAAVDPATGKPITVPGNAQISIGKTFNVLVDSKGNIVPNETQADPGRTKWVTYASGTIYTGSETTSDFQTSTRTPTTQTVWLPVSEIQNSLTQFNADGSYKRGVRTDIQINNANQRTAQTRIQNINEPKNYSGQPVPTSTSSGSSATYGPQGQSFTLPSGKTAVWNGTEYVVQ